MEVDVRSETGLSVVSEQLDVGFLGSLFNIVDVTFLI
jgi:hypothetical protein